MVYKWKAGSRIKADPNEAGALMERIEKTKGLTPEALLDEARSVSSPIHDEFEWDDSAAAEAYRCNQAAHLIRCLCIVPETESERKEAPVRAYFTTAATDGYENVQAIITQEDKYESLLRRALQELNAFIRKYEMLKELAPVKMAVQAIQRKDGNASE